MDLTGGPHPSAAREREGEWKPAGPGPRRRRGKRNSISFYVFYTKFPIEILSKKRK